MLNNQGSGFEWFAEEQGFGGSAAEQIMLGDGSVQLLQDPEHNPAAVELQDHLERSADEEEERRRLFATAVQRPDS
jgi:hypothetical protein